MRTRTRVAARVPTRVSWDVPVRIVPMQHRAALVHATTPRTVHRADAGIALPGVTAVRVTAVTLGGIEHVERIDPERSAARGASAQPTPLEPLADLIERLRDADGAVPVLVDGTPFTLAVLDALRGVRAGERCTYADLAAAVGRPRAVRAVASVMARNRVPLLLPCHRVVPSAGGTGRYGWGDAVKVALLDAEASIGAAA